MGEAAGAAPAVEPTAMSRAVPTAMVTEAVDRAFHALGIGRIDIVYEVLRDLRVALEG